MQLTPTLNNVVNIKWAADYGKNWVVGIWLVEKLTSDQLLDRLVRSPITSAANRLIGEVVQSQRRPLLGPSPG